MWGSSVRQSLFTTQDKRSQSSLISRSFANERFWGIASVVCAIVYAIAVLPASFDGDYIVQDDARQHVFWMRRFLDGDLFPNDAIADYFQSVSPVGYASLYRLAASFGLDPFVFNKVLPVFLGGILTAYGYGVFLQIFPIPFGGFLSTLVLNQTLWCKDDLISGTPRAFLYPIFLGFLFYYNKKNTILSIVFVILTGLFYPQFLLVELGILILDGLGWVRFRDILDSIKEVFSKKLDSIDLESNLESNLENHRNNNNSKQRQNASILDSENQGNPWRLNWTSRFHLVNIAVIVAMLASYALKTNEYAPVVNAELAKQLPEFLKGGRIYFFHSDPFEFWLLRNRSGFLPQRTALTLWVGMLLPILWYRRDRFPLLQNLTANAKLFFQISIPSIALFFIAHALLFKLHLPSRYSEHTLIMLLSFAAGISATTLLDAAWRCRRRRRLKAGLALLLILAIVIFPVFLDRFPKTYSLVEGEAPQLYEFFQQQPKDILIASTAKEADNLPTFAQRSILVGHEYAIPYHYGYYQQFRDRAVAIFEAQYSPTLEPIKQTIGDYNLDFWLLDRNAFSPDYLSDRQWGSRWRRQFIRDPQLIARLESGVPPALAAWVPACKVFETPEHQVLSASCLLSAQ
ncbi:hypothetical protein CKA32_005348 [Geitlerinema sp. FC II]|nr:hypothetical protein CKA32_005348 [Geitlerinema sp. FC II]